MKAHKLFLVITSVLASFSCSFTLAQPRSGPLPVPPPMEFASSAEHYAYLLEQAGGGTPHTIESIPQWPGLWEGAGNSIWAGAFTQGKEKAPGVPVPIGKIRPGVLTPAYEAAYRDRLVETAEKGEQQYDRLTHCEPVGYPRHLLEPYVREFVNLPHQSWMLNDVFNENRRVYIGKEHVNDYGTHTWLGDTIGFWDGDKLITHTVALLPVDYFRGMPLTSNQFESVETWALKKQEDGTERLEVQVTFYDSYSLAKPLNAAYAYRPAVEMMAADIRIRHWECATTNNAYLADDGTTQFYLPGEEGYKDPRGYTAFPDVPGQSKDPFYNTDLPQ